MSWILLEGLDRSGKSSVAEYYKKQGYEVVHMSAPDKRYFEPGYSGPSYLEEVVEMYNIYAGKDVVFDRTVYGELVWPEIFNRLPLLNDEDFEYLQQLEYNQNAVKYLMWDQDTEAHWKRCAANNEPINRVQFVAASRLYDKVADERGFERKQLGDFKDLAEEDIQAAKNTEAKAKLQKNEESSDRDGGDSDSSGSDRPHTEKPVFRAEDKDLSMEQRLDRANAIRSLLSGQIIKKKGSIYQDIEKDIRRFLEKEIQRVFNGGAEESFSSDEVLILKNMVKRIKDKME